MILKIKSTETKENIITGVNRVEIQIGESTYLLSESLGRLNINKSDGDNVCVHPRYANVVELS